MGNYFSARLALIRRGIVRCGSRSQQPNRTPSEIATPTIDNTSTFMDTTSGGRHRRDSLRDEVNFLSIVPTTYSWIAWVLLADTEMRRLPVCCDRLVRA